MIIIFRLNQDTNMLKNNIDVKTQKAKAPTTQKLKFISRESRGVE